MAVKPPTPEPLVVDGPAGALELVVEEPDTGPGDAVMVACHPHPLHQGAMTNKVVHTLARSAIALGRPAVRFNFRGVGNSEGTWDRGRGEADDALAVVAFARQRWPGRALWLGGFSFGAWIALEIAERASPDRLVAVAPPVQRFSFAGLGAPACPWLIVQGRQDELVDSDHVIQWSTGLEPAPRVELLDDADHFFHGRLTRLRDACVDFLDGRQQTMEAG